MSVSEIIKELPKLSEAERRAIREGLLEIANQHPDVALCNHVAIEGALMLDRKEDEGFSQENIAEFRDEMERNVKENNQGQLE